MPITYLDETPKSKITYLDERPLEIRPRNKQDDLADQFGVKPKPYNPLKGIQFGYFAPSMEQPGSALPVAGQVLGNIAFAGGGPVTAAGGGFGGALVAEGIRQKIGESYGVQDPNRRMEQFKDVANRTALAEGLGLGFQAIGPSLKSGAERIMYNYLSPSKALAQKTLDIARKALDYGVKGNYGKALANIERFIGEKSDELNSIIMSNPDKRVSLKNAFGYIDDEIAKARFAQADDHVMALQKLKQQFLDDYVIPVYGEEEVGQFVMGPASKQVTPQKTGFSVRKMPRSQREATGMIGGKGPRIVTEKTSLESPTDILAMKQSGKKGVSVSPKEEFSLQPEVKGSSIKRVVKTGETMRPVTTAEAQARKQAQYQNLKARRAGGGYGKETKSTDITGRQAYARGLKDDIVDALGGKVSDINSDISGAMDVRKALFDRLPIEKRQDLISLSDSILGGMSYSNPKVLTLMAGRKLLKNPFSSSWLAHGLDTGAKTAAALGSKQGLKSTNPVIKALLANEFGRFNY